MKTFAQLREGHGEFCLNPLHPGPCRGPRTRAREGVRGLTPSSAPTKKAAPAKTSGRAAPVPPQRGTVYGQPAKKASKKAAPPAKATGRANPGGQSSMPPTAPQRGGQRSASQDAQGTALMAMKDAGATRDPELYANNIARRVQMARQKDRQNGGGSDEYNRVVTEAALEMATVLARQAGGDAATQRKNRNDLANALSESMRTGNIGKVQQMKRELGISGGARVAAVEEDCGCGSAEGEYNTEEIPEEMYGAEGLDPRGGKIRRWTAMLAPIGVPTGDGRTFAAGALSARPLPLPLRWHREDEGGHKSVVVVGTIDEVEYQDSGVYGAGILFDPDPDQLPRLAEDVAEAAMLLEKGVLGPSVDLDDMEFTVQESAAEDGVQARPRVDVSKGRISAATLVQIPAFAETAGVKVFEVDAYAYGLAAMVASLKADAEREDAEEMLDDPEWTPMDILRLMDRSEEPEALLASVCAWSGETEDGQPLHLFPIRTWDEGRPVIVRQAVEFALKALDGGDSMVPEDDRDGLRWDLQRLLEPREAALTAAGAPTAPPAQWFDNPRLTGLTPLTVTEDGRVFGHLASWDTCHVGFPGACVTAPRSGSQYAYFHTGSVLSAESEEVAVGRITLGGGHADTSLGYAAAVAHYDDASTCVAYARAGEDEHGIWLAGVVAPGTTPEKIAALRAHPPSGDWRRVRGGLELMGAHAVNTPGFPVPRSRVASGAPQALVAAGIVVSEDQEEQAVQAGSTSVEDMASVFRTVVREERARERRAAVAVAALESPEGARLERAQRAYGAAEVFGGMPEFLKKKIKKRAEEEADEDDEGGDDKKSKAPFGGKQAPPFGKKKAKK